MMQLPFELQGAVVAGDGRGRQLGFPTANVAIDETALALADIGVYAARVEFGEQAYLAVANLGRQPTFEGCNVRLEVHLIDFDGDLYGTNIKVRMTHRLRDERRFAGAGELVAQIRVDIAAALAHSDLAPGVKHG